MPAPPTIAVLAGGASVRMGSDKTALVIEGMTMLDHVLAAAAGFAVLVVGKEHPGAPSIPDRSTERRGPLAGLVAALEATAAPVLLLGADQPWVRPATLRALSELEAALPVAPTDAGVRQVLCAVYPPSILPQARRLLEAGRGLQSVLDLGCRDIAPTQWRAWGEDGRSWFSVDTPDGLVEGLLRYGAPA
ncbi:MAG: molybdenum cofactor guanylyltransferase [Acidimicrobiia bacterium]|nr:molybdenum cofactor guanylyltransferase [Acidimicrobiia bacterium]